VVRIMCTARVDAAFIMEAFLQGVDGVLVGG
jgi:coenzyme F420-reducing hydrogenase delta subunit